MLKIDPQWKDLEIRKRSTKAYEIYFTKDGTVKDITGWTIYFTVKAKMSDTDVNAKIKKTITTLPDAINGIALISLSSTDTNLTPDTYYYSIDFKDTDNNEGVLVTGRLTIVDVVLKSRI